MRSWFPTALPQSLFGPRNAPQRSLEVGQEASKRMGVAKTAEASPSVFRLTKDASAVGPVPVESGEKTQSPVSDTRSAPAEEIVFGGFRVDLRTGELFRNGTKIKLQEQPLRVLTCLLERPGEMVSREELCAKVWPGGIHVDFAHCLKTAVHKVRRALGDSPERPRYIETVSSRGYRLIAPVESRVLPTLVKLPAEEVKPYGEPRLSHLIPHAGRAVKGRNRAHWTAPPGLTEEQADQLRRAIAATQEACVQSWAELAMSQIELWRLISPARPRGRSAKKPANLPALHSEILERHLEALARFINLLTPDQQIRIHLRVGSAKPAPWSVTLKPLSAQSNCVNRSAPRRRVRSVF
jgi:DNA-binding winged helix-turn-helix (wHTH) protein